MQIFEPFGDTNILRSGVFGLKENSVSMCVRMVNTNCTLHMLCEHHTNTVAHSPFYRMLLDVSIQTQTSLASLHVDRLSANKTDKARQAGEMSI